jgi:hypothetical protein
VFRRRMWPLAGRSVLESLRVLDWVDDHFGVAGPRVAGGVSTGGDVAVALAGVDRRIDRVAALVATPHWARPGMRTLGEDNVLLDQGEADRYAQWFFDALNPVTHLEATSATSRSRSSAGRPTFTCPRRRPLASALRSATAIRARPIGCGSSCTRVSTTSTRRGTSGCTPPRSNGWRRAGRRADRTAAENRWDRINDLTSTARMTLPTTAT